MTQTTKLKVISVLLFTIDLQKIHIIKIVRFLNIRFCLFQIEISDDIMQFYKTFFLVVH